VVTTVAIIAGMIPPALAYGAGGEAKARLRRPVIEAVGPGARRASTSTAGRLIKLAGS